MPEAVKPQIAAIAAVMDEIDQCRNPMPCDLCRQRMQSILDMGAAAERTRILARARECTHCGRRHGKRQVPPDEPFSFAGRTWADRDDGHAYAARFDVPDGPYDRKLRELLEGRDD